MRRLIRFSLEKLIHLEKDPQYKSVILYKTMARFQAAV